MPPLPPEEQRAVPVSVPPDGDPASLMAAIGEAPARTELLKGKPFQGPAGGVLNRVIHKAGITRSELYITNLSKEPIDNITELIREYKVKGKTHYELTKKGLYWKDILKEELSSTKANVFVPMGNAALLALCGTAGITKWRGSILDCELLPGRKVIPTIHPASSLYGNFFAQYFIANDFETVKEQSTFPEIKLPFRNYIINPSPDEAIAYLEMLHKAKGIVSWDIETVKNEVSCISFAPNPMEAMSVPLDKYSLYDEVQVWKKIALLMEDPEIPKLGMNLMFDTQFILSHNRIQTKGYIDDIMIAHHILYPDFPMGLDFLVSFNCHGEPYYKDEGKQWKNVQDWPQFWTYNCKDSVYAFDVWDEIKDDIREEGYFQNYRDTIDYFNPVNSMIWHGINVDPDAIKREEKRAIIEANQKQEELNAIVGYSINPRSHVQCKKYFYEELEIAPYTRFDKKKKKSIETADDKAMAKLARGTATRAPIRAAKLVQEIRGSRNNQSKYLNIKFDPDGMFRCSYNLRGTVTGRFSSSKTITQTGANHQNLPQSYRAYLTPTPGSIFIEWDLEQAEWVVVAFCAGDANMMKVIREGLDAHAVSGQLISNLPLEYVKLENDYIGHSREDMEIEKERQRLDKDYPHLSRTNLRSQHPEAFWPRGYSIRQCGKHSNHGFNYDMSAGRFGVEYETSPEDSKRIYDGYHEAYKALKLWYKEIQEQLDKDRTLTTLYGDKREFLGEWGDDLFKSAYDFIPQGTVSKNNKNGMVRLYNDPAEHMRDFDLLLEGHDSVLGEYPLGNNLNLAKTIMSGITHMHDTLKTRHGEFSIGTGVKIGFNWRDMIELKDLDKIEVGDLEGQLPDLLQATREKYEESRGGTIQ